MKFLYLAIIIISFLVTEVLADDVSSNANGNWSDGIWTPHNPVPGDNVSINHIITVDVGVNLGPGNLTIETDGVLIFTNDNFEIDGAALTVNGAGEIRQGGSETNPAVNFSAYSFSSTSTYTYNGTQNGLSGNHPNYGNLNFSPTPTGDDTFAPAGGGLNVQGNLTINLGTSNQIWFSTDATSRIHNISGSLIIDNGTIVGSNGNTGNATINIGSSLVINSGAIFRGTNSSANADFNIGFNLTNDGSWQQDDGSSTGIFTVNMENNLPAVQAIGGSSSISFENLEINNQEGITIDNPDVEVTGTFTHTIGKITLGSNNFTFGPAANYSAVPGTSTMFIATGSGALKKRFSGIGSFTYPVGTASEYSPVTLDFTSGIFNSAYADVNLKDIKHPNNSSLILSYLNKYWTINSSGISNFSCNLSCTYDNNDVVGPENLIYGGSYDGSTWTLLNQADDVNNIISGTISGFSDITGGQIIAMPVELSSFRGSVINNHVHLTWKTETEINNYGFEIERNLKAEERNHDLWEKISFIEGNGNSNSPKSYSFIDKNIISGAYLYRLKQLDIDGNFRYSKVIEVETVQPKVFAMEQNYPNPFNPYTVIKYQVPEPGFVTLKVYDLLGKEVAALIEKKEDAGIYEILFDASGISSGIYFYRLRLNNFLSVKKLIILK